MIKEAIERGFLKAALESGVNPLQAVGFMKQANPMLEYLQHQMIMHPELFGAAAGGLGGAGIGALSSKEHKGRNALLGGLGGAGIGAGIGHELGEHSRHNTLQRLMAGREKEQAGISEYERYIKHMQRQTLKQYPGAINDEMLDIGEGAGNAAKSVGNFWRSGTNPTQLDQESQGSLLQGHRQ